VVLAELSMIGLGVQDLFEKYSEHAGKKIAVHFSRARSRCLKYEQRRRESRKCKRRRSEYQCAVHDVPRIQESRTHGSSIRRS